MKMAVFCVVLLCSLVEVYQCFRGACCLHHQNNDSSLTQCNIPEEIHLHDFISFHLLHKTFHFLAAFDSKHETLTVLYIMQI
jgi:hypothetical protein